MEGRQRQLCSGAWDAKLEVLLHVGGRELEDDTLLELSVEEDGVASGFQRREEQDKVCEVDANVGEGRLAVQSRGEGKDVNAERPICLGIWQGC